MAARSILLTSHYNKAIFISLNKAETSNGEQFWSSPSNIYIYICCTGRADIWNMCCQITEIFLSSKTFISLSSVQGGGEKIPPGFVNWQQDNEHKHSLFPTGIHITHTRRLHPSPSAQRSRRFLPVLHYIPCIWFMVIRAPDQCMCVACILLPKDGSQHCSDLSWACDSSSWTEYDKYLHIFNYTKFWIFCMGKVSNITF